MNKKRRKAVSPKVKKYLQKEINSECPFCQNQDVGHFEIHHIDGNPENNEMSNLLMLCRICHSKITKNEIEKNQVELVKSKLPIKNTSIELVSITIDENKYNWKSDKENDKIFFSENSQRSISPHLVLSWTLINHSRKTIVLKRIKYSAISLPSGLTGPAFPSILSSLIKYKIPIKFDVEEQKINFINQIQIPEKQAFQFQTELFYEYEKKTYHLKGRFYLDIIFEFSNEHIVKIPRLFFNCKSESEELKHYGLN